MALKYKLLNDRFSHPAGTEVYLFTGYDYGLATDDSRAFNVPHVSVTLTGEYPCFTVPVADLERIDG